MLTRRTFFAAVTAILAAPFSAFGHGSKTPPVKENSLTRAVRSRDMGPVFSPIRRPYPAMETMTVMSGPGIDANGNIATPKTTANDLSDPEFGKYADYIRWISFHVKDGRLYATVVHQQMTSFNMWQEDIYIPVDKLADSVK